MLRLSLVIIAACLSGCAALVGNSPTFEYCNEVHYNRVGNQIDVTAKCAAPIGGGALPLPKP